MSDSLVSAYLRRIGVPPPVRPDLSALRQIHAAHLATIPFENLDILLGRGIHLDIERLRAKLVDQRRGGYCFEQNTLLLAVLRAIGFEANAMEARVRTGGTAIRPRTHMVLVVRLDDDQWLADAGFGGESPLEPVPMTGDVSAQAGAAFRLAADGPLRVLQMRSTGAWNDLYAFVPDAVHPIDFEVANWFTSTYPQSPFVRTLTAQRSTASVRYVLRYPTYSEVRGSDVQTRDITRAELLPLLRQTFLIDLPAETTFAAIDSGVAERRVTGIAPPRAPPGELDLLR